MSEFLRFGTCYFRIGWFLFGLEVFCVFLMLLLICFCCIGLSFMGCNCVRFLIDIVMSREM